MSESTKEKVPAAPEPSESEALSWLVVQASDAVVGVVAGTVVVVAPPEEGEVGAEVGAALLEGEEEDGDEDGVGAAVVADPDPAVVGALFDEELPHPATATMPATAAAAMRLVRVVRMPV